MTQKSKLTPTIPITSKYFKYVPACATDVRKTFEKVREAHAAERNAEGVEEASKAQRMFDFLPPKVTP